MAKIDSKNTIFPVNSTQIGIFKRGDNTVGDSGAAALSKALKNNSSLSYLRISSNDGVSPPLYDA